MKTNAMSKLLILISILSLGLGACSQKDGFEAVSSKSCGTSCGDNGKQDIDDGNSDNGGGDSSNNDGGSNNNDLSGIYDNVNLKAKISGGLNDGDLAIDIDKENNALLLILPLSGVLIDINESTIPELRGVRIFPYTDSNGNMRLAVSVPFEHILHGVKTGDPKKLPNGDPLPAIPNGELPSFALNIGKSQNIQFNLYIGVDTVAVFMTSPINLGLPLSMTFPIKSSQQVAPVGYFALIAAKQVNGQKHKEGFYMATKLPAQISRFLDDYF